MIEKRMDELIEKINQASYEYYVLDMPTITDQEYDDYYNELLKLESNYPDLKREDSPTTRVGGKVLDSFSKVEHEEPMLSYDDVFNEDEIVKFDERVRKTVNHPVYTVEPKMDGLSGSLIYKNGKLVRGATRGDGIVGEDITENIKTIKSIPLVLREKIDIEVRGEIYMSKKAFEKCNIERKNKGEKLFANPRNAAAGSVRQLDSKVAAKRNLDFMAYFIQNCDKYNLKRQSEALDYLKELGFVTNYKLNKVASNIKEVLEYIEEIGSKRDGLPFEIDGVVLKVNDVKDEVELGTTNRVPRWGIAYKFPAMEVLTTLKDIKFTVGRTGKITPNAIFDPVHVAGSIISKATLHNEDYVLEKDIRVGDVISVRKAGDVIPEVVEVKKERRTQELEGFNMIHNCPICNTNLVKKDANYFCPNENCDSRKIEGLVHFVSRDTMNIDGLGERIIEDFYNMNFIKEITDIYNLKDYREELIELEGFGNKSIDNLLASIENSKNMPLANLLFALGIRYVGKKTAKILAVKYKNIDNIMNATYDDLKNNRDIGEIIAKSVVEYFKNDANIELINRLKDLGLNMKQDEEIMDIKEDFHNKVFVLTGSLTNITRKEASDLIGKFGGSTTSSVSKNTDVVVVGDNPGSKYDKAKELGITIWDEEEFIKKVGDINEKV